MPSNRRHEPCPTCGAPITARRVAILREFGLTVRCIDCAEARPAKLPDLPTLEACEAVSALREVVSPHA